MEDAENRKCPQDQNVADFNTKIITSSFTVDCCQAQEVFACTLPPPENETCVATNNTQRNTFHKSTGGPVECPCVCSDSNFYRVSSDPLICCPARTIKKRGIGPAGPCCTPDDDVRTSCHSCYSATGSNEEERRCLATSITKNLYHPP